MPDQTSSARVSREPFGASVSFEPKLRDDEVGLLQGCAWPGSIASVQVSVLSTKPEQPTS